MSEVKQEPEIKKEVNYKWWNDKKMTGIFLLIVTTSLFIFSFMKIPFLTSIHKYTFGMLFGWYHPFFYFYIAYIALQLIFKDKISLPSWIKITKISYWFVAISVVFVSTQTGYFQSKGDWTEIGYKSWHAVSDWWTSFKSSGDAWVPAATNGGIVGAFLYSFFAMIFSGIGALIIAIIMLVVSISILLTGTSVGLYRQMINKKKITLERKEVKEDKNADISEITKEVPIDEKEEEELFPFDDPYK